MKITILSPAYPLRGGIAHFAGLLFKELSKQHEVKIITFKRQYPSILFPGKSQIEEDESVKVPAQQLIDSINPINWIKIGKKIKTEMPDLVIIKYWMPFFAPCFGTISRIIKKNKKTKITAICHNVIPHEKKPGDKSLTKYFFKKVDYFILLSEKVKNDLLKIIPGAKNKVLFHPVYSNFGTAVKKDDAKIYLKLKDEKLILFFGFIRDYKGLDVLLKAMSLLKDKINLKLVAAGEFYSNENYYKELVKKLKLENHIYFYNDFIPTSEVKYYFSAADVVILPYKSATQSGIVQIAMNFKKPVIASNVGGLSEVIKNNETGYIVEKENPAELAEAILKFYNLEKEEEFIKNINEGAEKYSWKKFSEGIMQLVNRG